MIDPADPDIIVASSYQRRRHVWTLINGGPGSAIHKTTDGGETWTKVESGLPSKDHLGRIGLAGAPSEPDMIYAIIEAEPEKGGLWRSDDAGKTWALIDGHRVLHSRAWYYNHITADPVNENTVYVLNVPLMKSIDGGKTFSRVDTPHGDNHYLWINPDNSEWMVNANDGGANVSFDGGASWSRQDNQPTAQFYRVNTDNQFEYRIYGGQQDNSTVAIKSRSRDGEIGRELGIDWVESGPMVRSSYHAREQSETLAGGQGQAAEG